MPRRPCCSQLPRTACALLLGVVMPVADAGRVLPLPAVDDPVGGGSSVLDPVAERAEPRLRLVFSCVSPGLITFADRPCGPATVVRELKLTVPRPPLAAGATPAATTDSQPATARTARAGDRDTDTSDDAGREHAETCRRLAAALDGIDSRMRTGYSAREAGDLWNRWREAKANLRAAEC